MTQGIGGLLMKHTISSFRDTMAHLRRTVLREGAEIEFWSAREIYPDLGYEQWRNFVEVIEKAKENCAKIQVNPRHHFAEVSKTIPIPKGASREQTDYVPSRTACYLIALNGDHAAGIRSLYGMNLADLRARKGISSKKDYWDRVCGLELSANEFKAQLTKKTIEQKAKLGDIKGQKQAEREHERIGLSVRGTVYKETGMNLEDLPDIEAGIENMDGIRALRSKPAGEGCGQLIVHHELHEPVRST